MTTARTPAPFDTYADSGAVHVSQHGDSGPFEALSPDEARGFAARLVELADYAENEGAS